MEFNAEQPFSDEEYSAYIHWLKDKTAKDLREAKGNRKAMKEAIHKYIETAYKARLSSGEVVDFFCVDMTSVLEKAGYSEKEADKAIVIFDRINPKLFAKYYPDNK